MSADRRQIRILLVTIIVAIVVLGVFLASRERRDSPAREYIRDSLEPYLDSLAYQLCEVKSLVAPKAPGRTICLGPPEGYKKPPGNGDP